MAWNLQAIESKFRLNVRITLISLLTQRVYSASSVALKRIYAVKKSPVYSHFEETICGTATVRAYRKQADFMDTCDQLTDISHKPWHQYVVAWRLVLVFFIFVVLLIPVNPLEKDEESGSFLTHQAAQRNFEVLTAWRVVLLPI
jgi:hypothetical protein